MLKNFLKKALRKTLLKQSKHDYKDHLYILLLAGGGGTRLWPLSRNKTPKQFLKLFGNDTLFQITAKRFREILPWSRIYVVTVSDEYRDEIIREVPQIPKENIIVEPARRDTAPAHGIGAVYIYKKDPKAVIVTESADKLVLPVARYLSILKKAARIAYDEGSLVAVGIEPRYPHTGFGYIKRGKLITKIKSAPYYKLDKFVEKPDLANAKKYLASRNYYWNAGEYVWRADAIISAIEKYAPEVASHLNEIKGAIGSKQEKAVIEREYKKMPKISIDYAVSEKSDDFVVIEGDFNWSDIGDWKEVWENKKKDARGNVLIKGEKGGSGVINIDASDTLIQTNGRFVAILGVDNVVVVDTEDALLIASKSRAQNVKKVVEKLKKDGRKDLL